MSDLSMMQPTRRLFFKAVLLSLPCILLFCSFFIPILLSFLP